MKPTMEDLRGRVEVLQDKIDLQPQGLQTAMDRLFGITHRNELVTGPHGLQRVVQGSALPPGSAFESLREAYVTFTGDEGIRNFGRRVTAAVSTFNFASCLANTVNGMLARDYAVAEADYRWRDIVKSVTSPENFKTQERSRMRFVGDLGELGEDEPYEDVSDTGDEKFTYGVSTFGGFLRITDRALLADRVDLIQRGVAQLARAAARTLAKRCWGRVVNNDVYGVDSLPVFHSDHNNLGAAALSPVIAESVAALNAAKFSMFAQTEPGSTERLGLGSGQLLLVVPIELEAIAREINLGPFIDAVSTPNPWFHRFGTDCERIFVNPLLSNSADWYLFDTSGRVGILELGFLMGHQVPQVILSNDPRRNPNLSQDQICYKMRFDFECAVEDYRGAWKSVVA